MLVAGVDDGNQRASIHKQRFHALTGVFEAPYR
jgi:hypothetical protein